MKRQGIDGEVPPVQVVAQRGALHRGKHAGGLVVFQAGAGHVDLGAVREDHHCRIEGPVAAHPAAVAGRELFGKEDAVPLHRYVDVQVCRSQQQVAHETANGVHRQPELIAGFPQVAQETDGGSRKLPVDQAGNGAVFGGETQGIHIVQRPRLAPASAVHVTQQVGARYRARKLISIEHRHETAVPFHHVLLDVGDGRGWNGPHEFGMHEVGGRGVPQIVI